MVKIICISGTFCQKTGEIKLGMIIPRRGRRRLRTIVRRRGTKEEGDGEGFGRLSEEEDEGDSE